MIIKFLVVWQLIGLVAFAVYAARAGEYWAARRRYTTTLRIALTAKNRVAEYRISPQLSNREMKPVAWRAKSRLEGRL